MRSALDRKLSSGRTLAKDLWSDGRGWILVAVAMGWLLTVGVRFVFPVLMPDIRAEFGFSYSLVGAFLTLMWAGFAVAQFPGGILGDRLGGQRVLAGSISVALLGLVGVLFAPNTVLLFVSVLGFGISSGLYATTRFTIVPEMYPEREGTAMGITTAAGSLGSLLIPAIAGLVTASTDWRFAVAVVLPMFAMTGAGLWRVVPRSATAGVSDDTTTRELLRRIAAGVTRRPVLLDASGMLLMFFVYQGFAGFYPTYLVAEKTMSESLASLVYAVFFFGIGFVVQLLAGLVSDVIGHHGTLFGCLGLSIVGFVLLPFVVTLPAIVFVTVLISAFVGIWPVTIGYIIEALPTDVSGSAFGFLRTIYILAGSTAPLVVGVFGDYGAFDTAFFLLAAISVVALGLFWRMPALESST